jgi:hypothetical protein
MFKFINFPSRLYISTRAYSHMTCINIHASAFRTIPILEHSICSKMQINASD